MSATTTTTTTSVDPAVTQFALASRYLPGGVSASARRNDAIGHPFFVSRGDGAWLYDLQGRRYLDMSTSHGASLLGHKHPRITAAVRQALDMGILCSAETVYQTQLAERITELVPCAEMVRFGGSGTETVMHGLRLARCATGREKLIKFEGHFHGYSDALNYSVMPPLDQAGPARTPTPYAESSGVPANQRAGREKAAHGTTAAIGPQPDEWHVPGTSDRRAGGAGCTGGIQPAGVLRAA